MTPEDIFVKVRDTLVDALGVDDDEVTLESRLEADLGAESIDFLDIVFRLEKNFGIKIPRGELFPEDLASSDSGLVKDGLVTTEGLASLKQRMPHFDLEKFSLDPKVENMRDMFTVQMLVNFVKNKLAV
ncbi:MAG: acyl carrier protein [Planctomycetia bacterium]|nr:acyl carrier protein [Planctomycetia bacterium]